MRTEFLAAVLLVPCPAVLAGPEGTTELDPILVTATRTAQTLNESIASVTVFTRAEIEHRQARSVADLLRGTPGVAVSNNGGPGKVTDFYLRGANSNQVLTLIDGLKVGSATVGTTPFENLPIDQIERVELVRGPRSSLYGSEAIGGVIQIFTKKGGGSIRPRFSVGGGSYDTYDLMGGVSGGGEDGWFNLSATYEDTRGFNSCEGTPFSFFAGCATFEPDQDGYRNASGNARAGYRFGEIAEVDAYWLGTNGTVQYDGLFVNESETEQQVLGARVSFTPSEDWDLILSGGRSQDLVDSFKDGDFRSRFDTRRDTLSLQSDLYLSAEHLLTTGVDYQQDHVDGTEDYAVDSRDNTGVFGQYQGDLQGHGLNASLRYDENEQFGGHTTGTAAWGYSFTDGLRVTASYGTAFKAPTFNDLYFPFSGNPDLDPEQSRSIELGLSGMLTTASWALNLYQTDIDDLIVYRPPTFIPENLDEARIRGLEAVGNARVAGWDFTANLTLLDAENRGSGPNRGNLLPRRPEQTFRLDLDRSFGRLRAGGSLFAAGRRYDDPANRVRMGGYALVGLRADYALTKEWLLQGRIENLFDADYETAALYNQPGRSFHLTLRYRP